MQCFRVGPPAKRGGPKTLPNADVLIDDNDADAKRAVEDKPRLVILSGGWGSIALLKELNPDNYHVTVISPKDYFLFTPMLPSTTVAILEMRNLVEPIRRILVRISGHYLRANAEDVDFSRKFLMLPRPMRTAKIPAYCPGKRPADWRACAVAG